jgi:hypothetical protein
MAEPVYKLRKGVHDIAVFENTYITKDGASDVFYSMNIQRSYKDKNGQWQKQTISETPEQALILASLIEKVATDIISKGKSTNDVPNDNVPF